MSNEIGNRTHEELFTKAQRAYLAGIGIGILVGILIGSLL